MNEVSPKEVAEAIQTQMCPWCGRGPWVRLSKHTHWAHGFSADDLREMAGLPESVSTCSEENSEQVRVAQGMRSEEGKARASRAAIAARDPVWHRENWKRAQRVGGEMRKSLPICDVHGNEHVRRRRNGRYVYRECGECEKARQREAKSKWWRELKQREAEGDPEAIARLERHRELKRLKYAASQSSR